MRAFAYHRAFAGAFGVVSFLLGLAACAAPPAFGPATPAPDNRLSPRAAATALEYVYVVNYNGNDIGQYGFYPQSKPVLKPIAANLSLPCHHPDSFVTAPHKGLAFVSCFSGEIVPLRIKADHTLGLSGVKPVPIPSPLSLLAPRSGAPDVLYVTEYPGAIGELHYGKSSLKLQHTYQTNSQYPDEMAFYSGGGKPELFVAAPYASVPCGSASTSGGVLVYAQSKTGALAAQPAIPACGTAYNVVVAGSNLYWTGANVFGAYSLTKNAVLPSPTPPWPANGGPSYYANATSVIAAPHKPKADTPHVHAESYSGFIAGSNNGNGYLVDGSSGRTIDSFTLGTTQAIQAATCLYYAQYITMGGSPYQGLCFSAAGDSVELRALPKLRNGVKVKFVYKFEGAFPIDIHISSPCDDYEYYYYYC